MLLTGKNPRGRGAVRWRRLRGAAHASGGGGVRRLRRVRLFLVRNRRRVRKTLGILALLTGIGLGVTVVNLPYYVIRPGDVRLGSEAVEVVGAEVHSPLNGIGYVTVSVLGPLSPLEWVAAGFDRSMEIVHESIFNRSLTPEQRREDDARLMVASHEAAKFVAFKELGYDLSSLIEIVIRGVIPCSAAEGRLALGDTILSVHGEKIGSIAELQDVIRGREIGSILEVEVRSLLSGEVTTQNIPLGSRSDPCLGEDIIDPDGGERPFLGVTLAERTQSSEVCESLNVCVDFNVGSVGGPSAGLVFTLTIIDLLTPGDLSSGCRVAATGTILTDGNVGEVGAVTQKAVAAERAGYDLMLVPSGQSSDALRVINGSLVVVEVGSVRDAVTALSTCKSLNAEWRS